MKKLLVIFVYLPFLTAVFALMISFLASSRDMSLFSFVDHILKVDSSNILSNGNFENGYKYWRTESTKGINIESSNNFSYIKLFNDTNSWITVSQLVELRPEHSYILSFNANVNSSKSFVLYRDETSKKETYLSLNKNNEWTKYDLVFTPFTNAIGKVAFSVRDNGSACFSNFCLIDSDVSLKRKFICIIFAYISLLLFIFILSYCVNCNVSTVFLVCLLMLLPIMHIDKSVKSDFENRNLTEFKPIYNDNKFNLNFGVDFNNWLNDHFFGRSFLMQINTLFKAFINFKIDNNTVLAGNNRWYFRKSNLNYLAKYSEDSTDNYTQTLDSLNRFSDFCKKMNADLYILIAPCNEEVYAENLAGINLGKRKYAMGKTITNLKNDTNIKLIYAKDIFEEVKQNEGLACYKTDHHWTELGAFRCFQKIITDISETNNDVVKLLDEDFIIEDRDFDWDFGFGTQFNTLNLPKWCKDKFYPNDGYYKVFKYKNNADLYNDKDYLFNKNGVNKKVFLFGDSMITIISKFFQFTFKTTRIYREYGYMNMKNAEKIINDYQPDIVVMIVYCTNFQGIKKWYR